jgi:hypothetical protein
MFYHSHQRTAKIEWNDPDKKRVWPSRIPEQAKRM